MKSTFKSRTFWLAVVQAIVGGSAALFSTDPTIRTAGIGAIVKSIVDIYLRQTTTQPTSFSPQS